MKEALFLPCNWFLGKHPQNPVLLMGPNFHAWFTVLGDFFLTSNVPLELSWPFLVPAYPQISAAFLLLSYLPINQDCEDCKCLLLNYNVNNCMNIYDKVELKMHSKKLKSFPIIVWSLQGKVFLNSQTSIFCFSLILPNYFRIKF